MPSIPAKMKLFSILAKTFWKITSDFSPSAPFHMKTRVCLTYFADDCCLKLASANFQFFTKWQSFKNYRKCFLFHQKCSITCRWHWLIWHSTAIFNCSTSIFSESFFFWYWFWFWFCITLLVFVSGVSFYLQWD